MTAPKLTPSTDWPKAFLLDLYRSAVENGLIFVEDISADDAESLRQRFYRVRRRADKSMAAFIPPEFQLVTVGKWQPSSDNPALGRLPIIFSKLPDGRALPKVTIASPDEAESFLSADVGSALPKLQPDTLLSDLTDEDFQLDNGEIDDFVARMQRKVEEK